MNSDTPIPRVGDWMVERDGNVWEVYQVGGRRGRVFSLYESAAAVARENASRCGGQLWKYDGIEMTLVNTTHVGGTVRSDC